MLGKLRANKLQPHCTYGMASRWLCWPEVPIYCTAGTWENNTDLKIPILLHVFLWHSHHTWKNQRYCKEEVAWVETRTGCAQRCQAAARWEAVLGFRKKIYQEWAESQPRLRFRAELKAIVMTEMTRHKKARTPKKKLSTSHFVRQDLGHQVQGI